MKVNGCMVNLLHVQAHVHVCTVYHSGMCSLTSDSTQSSEFGEKRGNEVLVTVHDFGSPKLGPSLS